MRSDLALHTKQVKETVLGSPWGSLMESERDWVTSPDLACRSEDERNLTSRRERAKFPKRSRRTLELSSRRNAHRNLHGRRGAVNAISDQGE